MSLTFPTSPRVLARATQWLFWLGLVRGGLFLLQVPLSTASAGGDSVLWLARGILVLGFVPVVVFMWRFTTWVGQVARGTLSVKDSRRLATWLRFGQVVSLLGVVVSGFGLAALLFPSPDAAAGITKLSPLDEVANLLTFGAGAGLLWTSRRWVRALALTSATPGAVATSPQAAVRSAQPWVRAMQVLTVLTLIKEGIWQPDALPVALWVLGSVLNLLFLECSLRFAWASAQESVPLESAPLEPSTA